MILEVRLARCEMGIRVNDYELLQKVIENGNYCLCTVEPTKCFCEEFTQQEDGVCHCGTFIKERRNINND